MPNLSQPQGVMKPVTNPAINTDGKYVIDFDMKEDNGVATASHLFLIIDDAVARTDIDLVFNPALLRTRDDHVHVEVLSNIATNLNIHTLLTPAHLADYATAPKRTVAIVAGKSQLLTIKKLGDVIVFEGAELERVPVVLAV